MKKLAKFWKCFSIADYEAIDSKDPDTLYFISETQELILGEMRYGRTDSFAISAAGDGTLVFSLQDNKLAAKAVLAPGSAVATRSDGLYLAPSVSFHDALVDGNFIYTTAKGGIKDSGVSLTTEVSSSSTDRQAPTAAAVYRALTRVAPIWDDLEDEEDLLAWQKHNWRNFFSKLTFANDFVCRDNSFFESNGLEVRFCIHLDILSTNPYTDSLYFQLGVYPKFLRPNYPNIFLAPIYDFKNIQFGMSSVIFDNGVILFDNTFSRIGREGCNVLLSGHYLINRESSLN
jgi:hypothetical protein